MEIYKLIAFLIIGIIIEGCLLILSGVYLEFKFFKGKRRRIAGEVFRDIGIAILISAALNGVYLIFLIGLLQ